MTLAILSGGLCVEEVIAEELVGAEDVVGAVTEEIPEDVPEVV